MQIKHQALSSQLQRGIAPLYILIGQDPFFLADSALQIRRAFEKKALTDIQRLSLNSAEDWANFLIQSHSYSLFAEQVLLDLQLDKKTLDQTGKKALQNYLEDINPSCITILRAGLLPIKQLQFLTNHEAVVIVLNQALNAAEMQQWITLQLEKTALKIDPKAASLIQLYTAGNMVAASQVIEKLVLSFSADEKISLQEVKEQLHDQSEYQLYDLSDAYLAGNLSKAIKLLGQAASSQAEPILLLWIISQDIRQLIQLKFLLQKNQNIDQAIRQLGIWSTKTALFKKALSRLTMEKLESLLQSCQALDELIKSNQSSRSYLELERLCLALCAKSNDII